MSNEGVIFHNVQKNVERNEFLYYTHACVQMRRLYNGVGSKEGINSMQKNEMFVFRLL